MRLHAHMTHPAVPTAQPHRAASLPPPAAPRRPIFDGNLTMRATQAAVSGRAREVCSHVRERRTFAFVRSLSMHSSPPASILPLRARAGSAVSHAAPACRCDSDTTHRGKKWLHAQRYASASVEPVSPAGTTQWVSVSGAAVRAMCWSAPQVPCTRMDAADRRRTALLSLL